ncbi:MAG: lysylphosphatidylglycerol synthase transmembrane domain-containing protein [Gemmatimonadetes bacterium]|nr:lysylphosphatidylglycerol synthase transmembrane domain-containing protein [Gemmatimonadota bacterium]
MKLGWKAWMGLAVSALLLWLVFRGEDLGAIAQQLATADPVWLLVAGAFLTSGGLIRALRWGILLEPLGVPTTLRSRWAALNIGFMITNLLPARLGEIVRPFALSRMAPVSMSGALGTIVLERLLDMVALVLLLLVTLLSPAFPTGATVLGHSVGYAALAGILVAAIASAAVGVLFIWPSVIERLVRAFARLLPGDVEYGAVAKFESFLSGLDLLRRPAAMLKAFLLSLLLWVWMAASFWTAFRAFGIELGATAAMFAQCAVSLFVALPAGPGFIGTLQAGVSVSVHDVFGVAAEPTLSLAIGYHLAGFIPVTLLGLYYAWRLGLRFGSIESDVRTTLEMEAQRGEGA